jgi:hypothetical protein
MPRLPIRSAVLLMSLLAAPMAAAQDVATITLVISVTPADAAKAIILDEQGQYFTLADSFDEVPLTISRNAGPISLSAGALSVEWKGAGRSSIPTLLIPAYSGRPITVSFDRVVFTPLDAAKADELCWNTPTDGLQTAFRKLFSCSDWVRFLQSRNEYFSPTYLKGLRGWYEGNYHVFTKVKPSRGLGLGPFGMQADLVDALEGAITTYDALPVDQRGDFDKFLRIVDIRQTLAEVQREDLKWFPVASALLAAGDYETAALISRHVLEVFDEVSAETGHSIIDGLSRPLIEQVVLESEGDPL